jgi:hypothetical protein
MQINELIIQKSHRKTLSIAVDKNGKVIVKVPQKVPENIIKDFINKHAKWILRQQAELKELNALNKVLYRGREYDIETSEIHSNIVTFEGTNDDAKFFIHADFKNKSKKFLTKWYISKADKELIAQLKYLSQQHQIQFKSFKLTNARTKWGSCSHDNKILLNWRLILLDKELIDYVIIHELCHVKVKNHSRIFWAEVEKLCPMYKELDRKLKELNYLLSFN